MNLWILIFAFASCSVSLCCTRREIYGEGVANWSYWGVGMNGTVGGREMNATVVGGKEEGIWMIQYCIIYNYI